MNLQYLVITLLVIDSLQSNPHNITLVPIQRPIRWENLWECFIPDLPSGTLRSIEGEEFYIEFKAYIQEKDITMADYVRDKILGYNNDPQFPIFYVNTIKVEGKRVNVYATGEKCYLRQFMAHPKKMKIRKGIKEGSRFILIAKNNFPYDLEKGISHWVIWSNQDYSPEVLELVLRGTMLNSIEWKIYQNLQTLKSIPQISHKQIFLRQKLPQQTDL